MRFYIEVYALKLLGFEIWKLQQERNKVEQSIGRSKGNLEIYVDLWLKLKSQKTRTILEFW